ncbi:MAG: hypothetical protein WCX84_08235 [Syntrophales bacterium]|jgi:hypothetical protein|nr:hypothetical protein [Syntrophales bacterium]
MHKPPSLQREGPSGKIPGKEAKRLLSLADLLDRSSLETNQNLALMIYDQKRPAMREIESARSKTEQVGSVLAKVVVAK